MIVVLFHVYAIGLYNAEITLFIVLITSVGKPHEISRLDSAGILYQSGCLRLAVRLEPLFVEEMFPCSAIAVEDI